MSYSTTPVGQTGTDGVHRDFNGNAIPSGLDEDTKAELRRQLEGPQVRVLASDMDMYKAAQEGGSVAEADTLVKPNESEDAYAQAFTPGYDVKSASDDGVFPGKEEEKPATQAAAQAPAQNSKDKK